MPRRRGTVWVTETDARDEFDDDRFFGGGWVWSGRFDAVHETADGLGESIEGVSAEDAIAWGRERAGVVVVRAGGGPHCAAGERNPDDLPPWAPAAPLARRRPAGEAWRDRTTGDPPIAWRVEGELMPPASGAPSDPRREAGRIAARADATSWRERPQPEPPPGPDEGWFSYGRSLEGLVGYVAGDRGGPWGLPAFELETEIEAATVAEALRGVADRMALPDGWSATLYARPAATDGVDG